MRKYYGGNCMKKWFCSVCEYIMEKENPKICPICNSTQDKLDLIEDNETLINNKEDIRITNNAEESIINELREIFQKECLEVGTYLAMGIIAYEEGYSTQKQEHLVKEGNAFVQMDKYSAMVLQYKG